MITKDQAINAREFHSNVQKNKVKTNNVPRNVLYAYELTAKERTEFDYIEDWNTTDSEFIRYRGRVIDLRDMEGTPPPSLNGWDGYLSDSFFSGIVVKFVDDFERVIVGTYYA